MGGKKNADRYRCKEDRERGKQPGRICQCHFCAEAARGRHQAHEAEGRTDFLSMPSYKTNQKDENGKDIYKDICFPRVKEFKDDLTEAVLECYLGIGEEKSGQR
jgi:hypothetical protein